MNDIFEKYEITLEDLVNYVEDNLAEDKIAKVVYAIESEKEIQELYSGFSLMKDENSDNSLRAEIDDLWKDLNHNAEDDEPPEEMESEVVSIPWRLPKYFYHVAAVLFISLISVWALKFLTEETPKELALTVLKNSYPKPEEVRGNNYNEGWKTDFLNEEYEAVYRLSAIDTTQQEELLFFAGLSFLLAENNAPLSAINCFNRVIKNDAIFYDDEAIFYTAIAYILLEENKKAVELLKQCKLQTERENIDQLLDALKR
ncbi:MAG: hypothetical protein GQ574_05830 [Crocinitomix sp.]|nr:hypothetical protein [Crocinitomix sp.]